VDDLIPLEHPVRAIWAFAEARDLKNVLGVDEKKLPHASVDPKLLVALWLWATVQGVGSARHLEKRCAEHLAYRWLCGGIEIGHQALRDFRLIHGEALDHLIADALAALVEEGAISLELISPKALKTQLLTGDSTFRKRRRLKALAAAAAVRVKKLRATLDRDDAIADERYNRDTHWHAVQQHGARAKAVIAQMKNLSTLPAKNARGRREQ
jgi:transposase